MMPTLGSRPASNGSFARGFTLLELMVVLALLGLAVALVAPAGFKTIASWRRSTDTDALLEQLESLSARAQQEGRPLHLPKGELAADRIGGMPPNWTVHLDEPLDVQANGACSGTSGELLSEGHSRRFVLKPPFCHGELVNSP